MIFIKNGIHMVAIREGSIINIQPNPKFEKNGVQYGAIMLQPDRDKEMSPIGVYPLKTEKEFEKTVYDVFETICEQIENGKTIISLPLSYRFNSIDEYHEFNELLHQYDKKEMINIYYNSINALS